MTTLATAVHDVRMAAYRCYHRLHGRSVLKPMIAGQRVLIVGTGPSAAELESIPGDVKIFTCKDGLSLFARRPERRRIDIYSCIRSRLQGERRLAELLERTRPRIFMSNDLQYVRCRRDLRGLYSSLAYDAGEDNTIVRKLIEPLSVDDIRGNALRPKISSGMRLLHYAVYFGAREIYLIGIDLGRNGYVWGQRAPNRPWNHADIDENFISALSTRHDNVFSLSSTSPIAEYVPYRPLTAGRVD
jgi:hypothetical protein